MTPKILIGCPTYEGKSYCFDEYAKGIKDIDYDNFDVLLADNSKTDDYFNKIKQKLPAIKAEFNENPKENIINSRNILRQRFLEGNYDYFLSLEQDIIPPKDIIKKLLLHKKDIIAGHYIVPKVINGKQIAVSTVLIRNSNGKLITLPRELSEQKELIKIEACGLGCVLISRKVLEKIKFRYEKEKPAYDDMWFSKDAKEAGFEMFLDPTVKCRHLIRK